MSNTTFLPPSGPFLIRAAVAADLPALVTLRDALNALELAGSPHAPIQRFTVGEFAEIWEPTLADPAYCWRVVEFNARLIGFGLIYLTGQKPPPGAFLHWAYLEPAYRHQGLGQLLFQQLYAWAKSSGANRLELRYIEGNADAEQFWAKRGFKTFARQCVLYLP